MEVTTHHSLTDAATKQNKISYWIDPLTFSSLLPKVQLLEGPPLFGNNYLKFGNMSLKWVAHV